jgi:hypothetical protein
MPGNEMILERKRIENHFSSGFKTLFLNAKNLCSGRYEIWMVTRIRGHNYLIYSKPFFIEYPSCTCEEVERHGYKCPEL